MTRESSKPLGSVGRVVDIGFRDSSLKAESHKTGPGDRAVV